MRVHTPSPSAVGLATFFICNVVLRYVFGPVVCNDGWASPSIGTQGACSWHGGVNDFPKYVSFLVSLVVAFIVWIIAWNLANKRNVPPSNTEPQMEGEGGDSKLLVNFGREYKKLHLETARNHGLKVISP